MKPSKPHKVKPGFKDSLWSGEFEHQTKENLTWKKSDTNYDLGIFKLNIK
jgi:hypothetical protein